MSTSESKDRIIKKIEREIHPLEDGYQYWVPTIGGGALSAANLRVIADELDRRNKEWEKKIEELHDDHKRS